MWLLLDFLRLNCLALNDVITRQGKKRRRKEEAGSARWSSIFPFRLYPPLSLSLSNRSTVDSRTVLFLLAYECPFLFPSRRRRSRHADPESAHQPHSAIIVPFEEERRDGQGRANTMVRARNAARRCRRRRRRFSLSSLAGSTSKARFNGPYRCRVPCAIFSTNNFSQITRRDYHVRLRSN